MLRLNARLAPFYCDADDLIVERSAGQLNRTQTELNSNFLAFEYSCFLLYRTVFSSLIFSNKCAFTSRFASLTAPEVVSCEAISTATDMWSIGVITFVLYAVRSDPIRYAAVSHSNLLVLLCRTLYCIRLMELARITHH